jgi:hypothetical protein
MQLDPVQVDPTPIQKETRRLGRKKAFDYRDEDYRADEHVKPLRVIRRAQRTVRRTIALKHLSDDAARELRGPLAIRSGQRSLTVTVATWASHIADEDLVVYFSRTPKKDRIDQEGSTCVSAGHVNKIEQGDVRQQIEPLIKPFGYEGRAGLYRFIRYAYDWMQGNDEWDGAEPSYFGTSERAGAQFFRHCGFWENFFWLREPEQVFLTICDPEVRSSVGIGSDWTTGMDAPDKDGFIHPTGAWRGGHFYIFDGANILLEKVRPLNSWGYEPPCFLKMHGLRALMAWGAGVLYYTERKMKAIQLPQAA